MLYAKISPAAQLVIQDGPFNTITKSAEHVTVSALNYQMGADPVTFVAQYGEPVYKEGVFVFFSPLTTQRLQFTAEQLATWGSDDSVVFNIVGQDQGFTVVEVIDTNAPAPSN